MQRIGQAGKAGAYPAIRLGCLAEVVEPVGY
jgi:hypothetical protein